MGWVMIAHRNRRYYLTLNNLGNIMSTGATLCTKTPTRGSRTVSLPVTNVVSQLFNIQLLIVSLCHCAVDKLIHYVNLDGRVNIFYSTPSIFAQALYATNYTWPVKTDDFFPYASNDHAYWTGYFTSRPALKRCVMLFAVVFECMWDGSSFTFGSRLSVTESAHHPYPASCTFGCLKG